MNAHLPQVVAILLLGIELGITATLNGKPRPPFSVVSSVVSILLWVGLLYWGGFFSQT